MARIDRLFGLLDALRRRRRPVTAATLAAELGVSTRTTYRDVQALMALGAHVEGEAGLGYVLRAGFFLPPLLFNDDEIEALVLGARWVEHQTGDAPLARAAANALAKIAAASPQDVRERIGASGLLAPPDGARIENDAAVLPVIRTAIRYEHKVRVTYVDNGGAATDRVIWPIALAFHHGARTVAAWCELRSGFRHFRADRIQEFAATRDRYPKRRPALVRAWRQERRLPHAE